MRLFKRKRKTQDEAESFKSSITYWSSKLSALTHQMSSSVPYAGDKREALETIIEDYQEITRRLHDLVR